MKLSPHPARCALGLALLLSLSLAACSDPTEEPSEPHNNAHNADPNNSNISNNSPNNGAVNNGSNNGTANNGGSNNSASNNGTSNNGDPNNGGSNNACPTPNACGGCTPLTGSPGELCGVCHDGTLTCEGAEALVSAGAAESNACGGCAVLEGAPGAPCGLCGDGALACEGSDALSCQGAAEPNPCGGCTDLAETPGTTCGVCADGQWACEGTEGVACQGATAPNACGGCALLDEAPGAPCGACGDGVQTCEGGEAVVCQGATLDCQNEALNCHDGLDNDTNGLADCDDEACMDDAECRAWACVDEDLGSRMGRPVVDDLNAEGQPNRWDDDCLTDAGERVFRWTAPRRGYFVFESNPPLSGNTATSILQVRKGNCEQTEQAVCGQGLASSGRIRASLFLEQGESVLVVFEGRNRSLGVDINLIDEEDEDASIYGGNELLALYRARDVTGDGACQ